MNTNEKKVLEHCKEGYILLRSITPSIPQSTLYRTIKNLLDKGNLDKKKDRYRTTRSGLYELEQGETIIDWDEMDKIYPHLKSTPTKLHRSIAELLLAAIVSRRDEIKMDHHPTFILSGATMKWKTWLMKYMCTILRLDPRKHIILMSSESGRSIFVRRGSEGKVRFKRDILNEPIVCFDEYNQAPPDIQKLCRIYLQGEKQVSFENEVMTIEPVPVFTLNPKESDKLEDKIGLSEPQIRRSIICDFNACTIPSNIAIHGDEILEEVRTRNIIELPTYRNDCVGYKESVHILLQRCTLNNKMKLIDLDLVMMLCSGMTAFLPQRKAIDYTLRDYLTVIETLGWTQPYWRKELDGFTRVLMNGDNYPNKQLSIAVSPIKEKKTEEYGANRIDDEINWTVKVGKLKDLLEENNVSINEVVEFVRFRRELKEHGFGVDEASKISKEVGRHGVERTIDMIKKYGSLTSTIRSLSSKKDKFKEVIKTLEEKRSTIISTIERGGSSLEKVEELLSMDTLLKEQGISLPQLKEFVRIQLQIKDLGLDLETMGLLVNEFEKGEGLQESINIIVRNIGSVGNLENAIKEKKHDMKGIKNRIKDLNIQKEKSERKIFKLQSDIGELEEDKATMNDSILFLEDNFKEMMEDFNGITNIDEYYNRIREEIDKLEQRKKVLEGLCKKDKNRLSEIKHEYDTLQEEIEQINGWRGFIFSKDFSKYDFPWSDLEKILEIKEGRRTDLGIWEENITDRVRQGLIDSFCNHIEKDIIPKWKHDAKLDKQEKMYNIQLREQKRTFEGEIESNKKETEKMEKIYQKTINEFEKYKETTDRYIEQKKELIGQLNSKIVSLKKEIETIENESAGG